MRSARIEGNMKEKNSPRFGRRREVVGQPAILRRAVAEIIIRKQRVLSAHGHEQRAEMNVAVIERIEMLHAGGGIGGQIECRQEMGVAGVEVVIAENKKIRR